MGKKTHQPNKLWGAAFSQTPSEAVIQFTAGRDVQSVAEADAALLPYDLWVNKAHCVMLAKTGIISVSDAAKILNGLETLEFTLDPSKEDVHSNIESHLTAKLGIEIAGKLHTARSRNDQALMFVKNTIGLVHTLLALADTYKSTPFPVDKKMTAELLGFDTADHNSMDAITNRWEPEADIAFAVVVLMNHLSLISKTLILMATPEFGMVKLSDAFSTGSSIMPQKKNPDPLEVIKGKTAFAQGQLVSLLSLGKANFIGYNRDSQWTKYIIMDLVRECLPAPVVLSGVLETMKVNADVMESWCHKGYIGATTVMEQMIQEKHIPMREAKVIVEKMVKEGSPALDIDPKEVIALTKSYGGPGKNSMKTSLKKLKKKLSAHNAWLLKKQKAQEKAKEVLCTYIQTISK